MKQDKLNKLMKTIDKTKKPKHWRKFINENSIQNNLILKCGKKAFCTHCQKYFNEDIKIHNYAKYICPMCKQKYLVRNNNLKYFCYATDVGFYTKIDRNIVLRIFEIESTYNKDKKKFEHDIQEYARVVPTIGTIINNSVSFYLGHMKIYHNIRRFVWHKYTGNKTVSGIAIYPFEEKSLFKDTVYEFAPINEFKEKFNRYSDIEILKIAGYESFELLWEMGLHRLSIYSKYFNKKGSFYNRFGIPKSFYKFMVDNDISYKEYKILQLIQEPNYELIQKYNNYDYNYLVFMKNQKCLGDFNILEKYKYLENTLRNICQYVPLRKFLDYKSGVNNINLYSDYLSMLKQLNYKMKCKKELLEQLYSFSPYPIIFQKINENISGYWSPQKKHIVLKEGLSIDDKDYSNYLEDFCVYNPVIELNNIYELIDSFENTKLVSALKSLSDIEQTVIFLLYEKKMTSQEISTKLKICSDSVTRINRRSIKKIKKFLNEEE